MQEQINNLQIRVNNIEATQVGHLAQSNAIKADTEELLQTFNALKGAWVVLNAIGKLAKPLTFIAALFGAWFAIKNGVK
jgi:hypothetical protein